MTKTPAEVVDGLELPPSFAVEARLILRLAFAPVL
jgi:hypothetical protein